VKRSDFLDALDEHPSLRREFELFVSQPNLIGANLRRAGLWGAHLEGAEGLTQEQIAQAIIDDTTILLSSARNMVRWLAGPRDIRGTENGKESRYRSVSSAARTMPAPRFSSAHSRKCGKIAPLIRIGDLSQAGFRRPDAETSS
jgi:hypothetical protein